MHSPTQTCSCIVPRFCVLLLKYEYSNLGSWFRDKIFATGHQTSHVDRTNMMIGCYYATITHFSVADFSFWSTFGSVKVLAAQLLPLSTNAGFQICAGRGWWEKAALWVVCDSCVAFYIVIRCIYPQANRVVATIEKMDDESGKGGDARAYFQCWIEQEAPFYKKTVVIDTVTSQDVEHSACVGNAPLANYDCHLYACSFSYITKWSDTVSNKRVKCSTD